MENQGLQHDNQKAGVKKVKVYTMPEKFYTANQDSGKKNNFLVVLIIIIVVLVIGLAGYFIIQRINLNNGKSNSNITNDFIALENSGINNNINGNPKNSNNSAVNDNLSNNSNNLNYNSSIFNSNQNNNVAQNLNGNVGIFQNLNSNTSVINSNANIATSQDTDKDGLTDIEEALFGTNLVLPDSDSDSFSDGQEVLNGYDPNGPGKLENSSKVRLYLDSNYGYSILYPSAWVIGDDPQNSGGKVFSSGQEFVLLDVQENPANLTARDWYLSNSPGVDYSGLKSIINWKKDLSGILSADGLTAYYARGSKIYIINYNINLLSEANYHTTFEMMYKSFNVQAATILTNANSNSSSNVNFNINIDSNSNTNNNSNSVLNSNTNTNNLNANTGNNNRL